MMRDEVCIVTGATSGIGEATALALARMGATVVIVGRNPQKCQNTVARIRQETANPHVSFLVADLTSQRQIRKLAEGFKQQYDRLDVLVNNAGAFFYRREVSEEGIEKTFALNHLNYFTLTNLLLDVLKASAPARVVNVASNSHYGARLDFDDLQMEKRYNGLKAYGRSKFANVLFTYELARRLEGTGVTANALHPGLVSTNIGRNGGWLVRLGWAVATRNALNPEEGARTSVYLASSPEVKGVSGKYFVRCEAVQSDPGTYDREAARRLWEASAQMTGVGK